jgi:hypothetical protein
VMALAFVIALATMQPGKVDEPGVAPQ